MWSMATDSRWPGLPLVVFPGNVGGKEALVEAMDKARLAGGHSILMMFILHILYSESLPYSPALI